MKNLKKVLIAVITSGIMLGLAACRGDAIPAEKAGADKNRTVKIAYLPITHALPLFVENKMSKENFNNISVELIKFSSWPELMDALSSGKVDGASVLIELAMKAKEQGINLKAVALGHRDGNAVIVAPDINSPSDLKGKAFAIPHRLSTHNVLLYLMLKNAGLEYSDINVVELPPPEMPAALAEGRISGYIVAEPFGAKSVVNGKGKALFKSEDIWKNSICCALVLREDFIKSNDAAVQELLDEYIKAGKYVNSNGGKVSEILGKYLKVEQEVLDISLKWISYKDLKIHDSDYNDMRKYMIEMGLSENPPSYADFIDNTFIDKVK